MRTKTRLVAAATGLLLLLGAWAAQAQVRQLYWASSGLFGPFPVSGLIPGLPKEKLRDVTIPVSMWVIEHAKGLVVFDTGNNVAVSDGKCESHWGKLCQAFTPTQSRDEVIDRWLAKFGHAVDDVKYVVVSHMHLDHAGNIEMFPKATIVVQKEELRTAWWPEKFQRGPAFVMGDFDGAAMDFNYLELEGDYDLFGDGSITILSTPGHTLGHQSIRVKTAAGNTYVITGDAVWMQENLDGYPAGLNYSVKDYNNSINRLKAIRDLENAELFMSHDQDQWRAKGARWYK